ncbi:efflux RND transporter periplasmic adaptor subunit [Kitasatospora cheerisanensis]|uniref:Putative transporter n=1 Tax=Kitasatospora cheerisanensis KCTC 2395 TaxID=1348663 RepID=A0A066YSS0_9ACTN|nr:biotin/lipoyl-binding protein [Kitasatospora cheerisanensis]KDN84257.1 putative transporter [Kitasatospora cheerisanensis KCTC 2395]
MKVLPRRRGAVLVNSALGVALLGGAALAYTTLDSGTSKAATGAKVRTATVTQGTVQATVSGSGTLFSPSDAGQDFTTGGRLTAVKVSVGDAVKKGQVLATVDTTAAQQQVDQAQSALTAAEANLTKAEAGETVTTTVPGTGGSGSGSGGSAGSSGRSGTGASGSGTAATTPQPTTTTTVKIDQAQIAQAQQQVDNAQTTLTNAKTALAGTTLTATTDGTVASVSGKVGETVSGTGSSSSGSSGSSSTGTKTSTGSGSSSTTPSGFIVLTNPSGMEVTANFSELDSLKLKKGQSATVTLNAQSDTKLAASVLSVSSLPSSSTNGAVQYGAVLQITGDTSTLRTGLSATISVVTGSAENALSVPTAALQGTGATRTATVVHDDGSTERVQVGVGIEGDTTVQVVDGLTAGEKVELTATTAGTGNGFPSGSFPGLNGGGFGGGAGGFGGGTGGTGGGTRGGGTGGSR